MGMREPLQIFPLKIERDLVQITFLGVPSRPGDTRPLFDFLERRSVPLRLLLVGVNDTTDRDIVICINRLDFARLQLELDDLTARMQPQRVAFRQEVALIRILGPHFDIRPGPSGLLFSALTRAGVQVFSNSTTLTSSTCVIPETQVNMAVRAIGRTFEIPKGKK
jgi:aspartokinase